MLNNQHMTRKQRGGVRKECVRFKNWPANRQKRERDGKEWAESKSTLFKG